MPQIANKKPKTQTQAPKKVAKVMGEFKAGTLKSGGPKGPTVTNPRQAVAIGYSEARKGKK